VEMQDWELEIFLVPITPGLSLEQPDFAVGNRPCASDETKMALFGFPVIPETADFADYTDFKELPDAIFKMREVVFVPMFQSFLHFF
jgi:hypothetical protein